jgi:Domain of unknown function (DUF4390)
MVFTTRALSDASHERCIQNRLPMIRFGTFDRGRVLTLPAVVGFCAAMLFGMAVARAELPALEDGGAFDVRSAYLEPSDRVYHLNATLDLALAKSAEQALKDGVPVVVILDLVVSRQRQLFPDERVATLVQRWRLQYHALSERYVVVDLGNNQQSSYATLAAAVTALSDVHMLPVLEESSLKKGSTYEASARVTVMIEGGLPNALRTLMFWMDWKRVTEWYTWTVAR